MKFISYSLLLALCIVSLKANTSDQKYLSELKKREKEDSKRVHELNLEDLKNDIIYSSSCDTSLLNSLSKEDLQYIEKAMPSTNIKYYSSKRARDCSLQILQRIIALLEEKMNPHQKSNLS